LKSENVVSGIKKFYLRAISPKVLKMNLIETVNKKNKVLKLNHIIMFN